MPVALGVNGGVLGSNNLPSSGSAKGIWTTNEIARAVALGFWPVNYARSITETATGADVISTGANADPYFNLTTLLLSTTATNGAQNNIFQDSSTNNFTITRNGNTTQGTFSPFSQTGWGNYFDGTGDYLSVAASANQDFGSSAFTVEFWWYPNADSRQWFYHASTDYWFGIDYKSSGSTMGLWASSNGSSWNLINADPGGNGISTGTPSMNAWNHVAVGRSSGTWSMWLNGTRVLNLTGITSAIVSRSAQAKIIGGWAAGSQYIVNGYLSNFRVVIGTDVYGVSNSTITVPTAPLTAITNTQLLTCQSNRFIDNSTNNFTITRNGDTRVVPFSPFNPTSAWSASTVGGSGYFDGNGDYLSVADNANLRLGTSAFTIQAWVYRNASGTAHSIIAKGAASTGYVLQVTSTNVLRFTHGTTNVDTTTTIPASSWTHVAAVRTNTSTNGFQLYINGVSSATATVSTDFNQTDSLYIGGDRSAANVMNGYISGLKYTNGTAETISVPTAPPTATTNVALLTNFTNAGVYDATSKNDLETVGDAQISNTTAKWGSTSIKFDGTGDYLRVPDSPLFSMGSGNFTIDGWVYRSGSGAVQIICCQGGNTGSSTSFGFRINSSNQLSGFVYSGTTLYITNSTATVSANQWVYVAMVRDGNTITLYINGSADGTVSVTGVSVNDSAQPLGIGTYGDTVGDYFNGYIQDLRITRGYARTIATPTAAFPTL